MVSFIALSYAERLRAAEAPLATPIDAAEVAAGLWRFARLQRMLARITTGVPPPAEGDGTLDFSNPNNSALLALFDE